MSSKMDYHTPKLLTKLSPYFRMITNFLVFYTFLLVFSIPILSVLLYRSTVQLILALFYRGKYTLIRSGDACYAIDSYGNVLTVTVFFYLKDTMKINHIRKRLSDTLLKRDASGRRPFQVLVSAAVQKFGYSCFEDKSDSMDFSHHVRYCPGADDPEKVYSEEKVMDKVSSIAKYVWDEDKPRWDVLVIPRVLKKDQDSEQICTGVVVRVHHVHCDGISVVQFVRNCLFDQPAPKLSFDPVNPPIPPVPFWQKVVLYLQVFFLGPYSTFKLMGASPDPVFYEGLGTGHKLFGRTKMEIPLEMMRRMRKAYGVSTDTLLHSAFTGALGNLATEKKYQIRDETIGGFCSAWLPYPDETPRNHLSFAFKPVKFGIVDPHRRLAVMRESVRTISGQKYALTASSLLLRIIGIFPTTVATSMFGSLHGTYFISNVPATEMTARFEGNECLGIFGLPPNCNGIGYAIGVCCYRGNFCVAVSVEKSKIVGNRADVERLISEFEKEVQALYV